jgi:hypothetical protein
VLGSTISYQKVEQEALSLQRDTDPYRLYQFLFFFIVLVYCFYYAPYGINQTDGGFITSLAWQVVSGKTLYSEISYVRPPLPIWLRALELKLLPDMIEIVFERNLSYLHLAFWSWLSCALLTVGATRWFLATVTFIIAAHCYPAAAWHTNLGLFFGVLSISMLFLRSRIGLVSATLFALLSELCKQVFLIVPLIIFVGYLVQGRKKDALKAILIYAFGKSAFYLILFSQGSLDAYFTMTSASTTGAAFIQHGLYDFIDIPLPLAGLIALMMSIYSLSKQKQAKLISVFLAFLILFFITLLIAVYLYQIHTRQQFTAPFLQSRGLWWVGSLYLLQEVFAQKYSVKEKYLMAAFLGLNWASAVSWGYNLPIFLPIVGVFALREMLLHALPAFATFPTTKLMAQLLCLLILLGTFRYGYQFIYRDGQRSQMHYHMGEVFPKLTGIYSTQASFEKYTEFKTLQQKYPDCTVLPTMTLANYLTDTKPKLPLNWVVERELGGKSKSEILVGCRDGVFLVEKILLPDIEANPEYALVQSIVQSSIQLEETEHFRVVRYK